MQTRIWLLAGGLIVASALLLTGCFGGSRSATVRKNAFSVLDIGRAKADRRMVRQPSQLSPSNVSPNSARNSRIVGRAAFGFPGRTLLGSVGAGSPRLGARTRRQALASSAASCRRS